jgi:two-component system, LytTR family, response regulator
MPGLDGFGVIDALQDDEPPYIVFVTADDQQALRAFEAGAVDYLLKPFTPQRFAQVIERARARQPVRVSVLPAEPGEYLKRILIFENGRATFVPVAAVDRVQSERNYVLLHAGGRQHRLRATIATVEARLDPAVFLRINRSTLVCLDAVRSMTEWSHGDYKIIMNDGTELTWSRRYRGTAARKLGLLRGYG